MGGKGGIAEAWAAEEEEMELMRDELEAAEQVVSVCAFARPRAAREGFRVCCCVRASGLLLCVARVARMDVSLYFFIVCVVMQLCLYPA